MAKPFKIQTIIEELQNASKMHLRQSKELASHAKDMNKKSPLKQDKKKNEINLRANRNTQKSETDAGGSTSSLSGGVDYKRDNLKINASGDTKKNYNFGLQLSNNSGNFSGGVNYNMGQFSNTVSGNLKLKF
tara:strand:+ start:601 stop:996 length:396 start_codon:yes stop_codon:yes gene_type:complete